MTVTPLTTRTTKPKSCWSTTIALTPYHQSLSLTPTIVLVAHISVWFSIVTLAGWLPLTFECQERNGVKQPFTFFWHWVHSSWFCLQELSSAFQSVELILVLFHLLSSWEPVIHWAKTEIWKRYIIPSIVHGILLVVCIGSIRLLTRFFFCSSTNSKVTEKPLVKPTPGAGCRSLCGHQASLSKTFPDWSESSFHRKQCDVIVRVEEGNVINICQKCNLTAQIC